MLEAASDLGASRLTAFRKVTLPLSMPGVLAAFLFVFIPTLGEFVTPSLVGGANGQIKGNRHVAYERKTVPTGNLLLTIQDLYGVHLEQQGDSTGRLQKLV